MDHRAHLGEEVDRQAHGAEPKAAQVFRLGDRRLEPAERLRWHRAVDERFDLEVQRAVDLLEQLAPAAVGMPGKNHVGAHAERRPRPPECHRGIPGGTVGKRAVRAVEDAAVDRVEHVEGFDDRAGREHVVAQPAARHVVHLAREVVGELVEDVLGRPGALEAKPVLGAGCRGGCAHHGAGGGRADQELPPASGDGHLRIPHPPPPACRAATATGSLRDGSCLWRGLCPAA